MFSIIINNSIKCAIKVSLADLLAGQIDQTFTFAYVNADIKPY